MLRSASSTLVIALSLAGGAVLGSQAAAQDAMTPAQCQQLLIIGPDRADPAMMSACMPYFTTLAENALAPGTFATTRSGGAVTVSTSGSGQ